MEAKSSDRWSSSDKHTTVSSHGYSGGKVACLLVIVSLLSGGAAYTFHLARPSAAVAAENSDEASSSRKELIQVQRDLVATMNRVTSLERTNDQLVQEISLLTGREGVLAGVISQIRELKGQNEFLHRDILGAGDESVAGGMEGSEFVTDVAMPSPRARHLVVTPREPALPAEASESESEKAE